MKPESRLLFETEVPAKWVLTGEHAVLRGGRAITFPHPQYRLKLRIFQHRPACSPITMTPEVQSLVFKAGQVLNVPTTVLSELAVEIDSTIPVGSGLGSSAAICVALARGMMSIAGNENALKDPQACISLATHLEDVFHGKSSGMDIHAIAYNKPLLFSIREGARALPPLPAGHAFRLEWVDTGLRGRTRDCIARVNALDSAQRGEIDEQMNAATELALQAWEERARAQDQSSRSAAVRKLAHAIQQAQGCFEAWGLVPTKLIEQKTKLLNQGVLAVKLTGAGLGGFWVVLWPET
jgi:mevalonate kinase